jgi:hypothetical protein
MRLALLSLLALAPVLSAQDYIDRFDYADGTTIPGWTERQGGDFQILNKQLVMLSGGWSQVTLDKYKKRRGLRARHGVLLRLGGEHALCRRHGAA